MTSSRVKAVTRPEFDQLRRAGMFRFTARPRIEAAPFVIGWTKDTGAVSRLVAEHLIRASHAAGFCQIEPASFYSLGGVTVNDDVAQFPQSRFFYSERDRVVTLRADEPQSDRYEFLNAVLDLADVYGRAETLYTVNGLAALTAHTVARRVFGVFNDPALQTRLRQWVPADMSWQGPPHASTYLLWLAHRRNLPAAGLWVEVPFYLSSHKDYQAARTVISRLSAMLGVDLEFRQLDRLAAEQQERLAHLEDNPDTADKIRTLEEGGSLDRQEQVELAEAAGQALKSLG
jgi:proteasome assembly chaperone (PAC2) family protein